MLKPDEVQELFAEINKHVYCSMCGSELKPVKTFAEEVRDSGGDVFFLGSLPSSQAQWLGTCCIVCRKIYCEKCRPPKPGKCQECDTAHFNPAMSEYLDMWYRLK
ncbi:MAG: hypothetical protein ISS69_11555 [Phycisphaerae bacterium]|nr:hypothetical protein [Phycisphaerae bacterium]